MVNFKISLSNIPIIIKAMNNSTKDFCKDYLTEEAPLFSVVITQADIDKMQMQDMKTALAEKRTPINHTDSYLEKFALANVVLEKLIDYGVLLFHGSVIAKDNKAYLFTAKSGIGKTTHCRLWLKNIPDCHILNGDKPLVLFKDGKIFACGSPWMGKEKYGVNEILPLEGICILERAEKNRIEPITLREAFPILIAQFHRPEKYSALPTAMRCIGNLNNVRLYRLRCNMEDEAALVSYRGMVKE